MIIDLFKSMLTSIQNSSALVKNNVNKAIYLLAIFVTLFSASSYAKAICAQSLLGLKSAKLVATPASYKAKSSLHDELSRASYMERVWLEEEKGSGSKVMRAALESALENEPIVSIKKMKQDLDGLGLGKEEGSFEGQSGLLYIVELESGIKAIFRDSTELKSSPHSDTRKVNTADYEIAVYKLDKLLGVNSVPSVVKREINGMQGSLQIFIEGSKSELKILREKKSKGEDLPSAESMRGNTLMVFDYLLGNTDRNLGNLLFSPSLRRIAIDHSNTHMLFNHGRFEMSFYKDVRWSPWNYDPGPNVISNMREILMEPEKVIFLAAMVSDSYRKNFIKYVERFIKGFDSKE